MPEILAGGLVLFLVFSIALIPYSIFPWLFSKYRKKPIGAGEYRLWCFVVNFLIQYSLSGEAPDERVNIFAYLVWTLVFSAKGIKRLRKRGRLKDHD